MAVTRVALATGERGNASQPLEHMPLLEDVDRDVGLSTLASSR